MLNTSHSRERYHAGWTRRNDIRDELILEHASDFESGREAGRMARKAQAKAASSPLFVDCGGKVERLSATVDDKGYFAADDFDSAVHASERDALRQCHTAGDSIDATVNKLVSWLALPDVSGGLRNRLECATASVQDAFADARLRLIDLLTHTQAVSITTRERYCDQWGMALSDEVFLASIREEVNQAAHDSLRQWAFTGSHNGMPFVRQSVDEVNQVELDSAVQAMHHHLTDGTRLDNRERFSAARRIFRKGYVGMARALKASGAKANVIALKLSGRRKLCRTLAAIALGESMDLALERSGYKSASNFYSLANRSGVFSDCGLQVQAGRMTAIDVASHLSAKPATKGRVTGYWRNGQGETVKAKRATRTATDSRKPASFSE